nr:hypothetical protein [Tanacetum cinerariifolium]
MHSYDDLIKYADMEKSYIDEYNKCLELEAELVKKKDMVEKRKNREARVDYLKITKEHADTLREIVKQARALKPLDNALDYACKYAKQI